MSLTPENIAEKEFTLGLRGYDKDEVRSYLETVADGLRVAIDAAAVPASSPDTAAEAEADKPASKAKPTSKAKPAASDDEPTTAPDGTPADSSTPDWSNLGDEIASVLRTAHEQANGLQADAESEATTIRDLAQQEADAAQKAAEQDRAEAAAALEKAQQEALDLVANAQVRIDDRMVKAKETANSEAEASIAGLTEKIAELTSTRDEVRAELTTLRSRLDDTISASTGDKVSAS